MKIQNDLMFACLSRPPCLLFSFAPKPQAYWENAFGISLRFSEKLNFFQLRKLCCDQNKIQEAVLF